MAGYDIFTNIQGPTVPVSLYGDAASQGANVGNAVPTGLTAGIQGAIKGIQQGQQIAENYQQAQIRQNQIEQIPITNRRAEADAQNAEAIAQINQSRAQIDQATQTQELEATRAKLESEKVQAQTKATDLTNQNAVIKDITSGDALAKASILDNASYGATFARDTDFANKTYANIWADTSLPDDVRAKAKSLWDRNNDVEFAKQRDLLNRKNQSNVLAQYEKAQTDFLTDGVFANATRGLNQDEIFNKIEVYPKGTKHVDPATNKIIRKDVNDKPQEHGSHGQFTVYRDGTPIIDSISTAQADKFFLAARTREAAHNLLKEKIYGSSGSGLPDRSSSSQQTQTQAAPVTQSPSLFGNTGSPGTANGNVNIVEQRRAQYENLVKNPPAGIDASSEIEKLGKLKTAIRQGVVALDKGRQDQISLLNLMQNIRSQDDSFNKSPFQNRASYVYNSPDEALSETAKQPVVLNLDKQYPLDPKVRATVDAEPLLQKLPPLLKGIMSVDLFKGQAAQESRGEINAESPTGVKGLLQVTRSTAAMYGLDRDIPEENVLAGQLYMNDIYDRFNGDLRLTLAAYNAGPGIVKQAKDLAGTTEWGAVKKELKGLLSDSKYEEVSTYPDKVISKAAHFMGTNPDDDLIFYGMLQSSNLIAQPSEG